MENGGAVLMDLLWRYACPVSHALSSTANALFSDPTENDSITGLRPNARGPGLVTFGPDRVKEFLDLNNLQARPCRPPCATRSNRSGR
jgi:protein phosphatase